MEHTTPSKKIYILGGIMTVVIIGAFYYKYSNNTLSPQNSTLSYNTSENDNTYAYATTSIFVVDTKKAFNNPASSDTDNVSDRFTQLALANYVNLQTNGASDDETAQAVVSNLATQAAMTGHVDTYSPSDIKTFSDSDKIAVKNYGNSFAKIENASIALLAKSTDLANTAKIYEKTSQQLLQIPAPQSISSLHLQEINYLHNMSLDFQDFINYENDPIKSALAMNQLQTMQSSGSGIYTGLSNYFKTSGIIFSKDDPGYKWTSQ